jgi:NAD+ synthase
MMKIKSSYKKILDEMRVLPNIDPQFEVKRRVTFIKSKLLSTGLSHLVLGISGGIDSATCGRLAQIAINELSQEFPERSFSFVALRLPYGEQIDEIDAQKSIKFICPSKNVLIDIKPSVDITHERINSSISSSNLGLVRDEVRDDFTKGNTKARIRMTFQYEVASALGRTCTWNRSFS